MRDEVAVVTGAGSGIGRLTALELLHRGYQVTLAGRRVDALEQTRASSSAPGDRILVAPTDVTDACSVADLFSRSVAAFGRVDLLFNNAGTFEGTGPLDELTAEQWRKIIDVNLTGAFLCAQAAFRCMKTQQPMGGRIINNGSISAQTPRPHAIAYTASKHAITGLTKSLSLEGRPWNIACGQIDIGNAATDMTAGMPKGMLQADGSVKPEPTMNADHVVQAVLCMAGLPLDANVQFLTITATNMPFIGRG